MNKSVESQIQSLLQSNCMTENTLDMNTMTQLFLTQMKLSLYGGQSSVPLLPSFLPSFGSVPEKKCVVAVAHIDSESVSVCRVIVENGQFDLQDKESFPVPGREYPAPFADLIFLIAELLEPLLENADTCALSFSFPLRHDGKGDAVLYSVPGNMRLDGYENVSVLDAFSSELAERNIKVPPLVLLSDPQSVQAAGSAVFPGSSRYLGLTWTETIDVGFAAPGFILVRWPAIDRKIMLFNGGFSSMTALPFAQVDMTRDRDSYAPGKDLYEKMVGTGYLGDTFRLTVLKAAEKELLCFPCARDFLSLRQFSFNQMCDFLREPSGGNAAAIFCREESDREVVLAVAEGVLDRAARMVSANLSAVLSFVAAGKDPSDPACISVSADANIQEFLLPRVQKYLDSFTAVELGLHAKLKPVINAEFIGAAVTALRNL